MPKGRKRKSKSSESGEIERPKLRINISPLFKEALTQATPEVLKAIKSILLQSADSDLFVPGKKFKVLRIYKNYKIWYMRAGRDCRLTATYGADGALWLLSIETHDTLDKAPRRVIHQVRDLNPKPKK